MGKPKVTKMSGAACKYLGHFKQDKVLREGHNTMSMPAMSAATRRRYTSAAVTAAAPKFYRRPEPSVGTDFFPGVTDFYRPSGGGRTDRVLW